MNTLLIPGPVSVEQKYLEAMTKPMIGHRGKDYKELHASVVALTKELLSTDNDVFLITSSATGAMEAAVRNTVRQDVLCLANGDFGRRWHDIALSNGKEATLLDFGDGKPYDHKLIADALTTRKYEAVTVVINDTATGIENDLKALKKLLTNHPHTLLLADAVTAAFGTPIDLDGIDVLVYGTQKALALPPGLAVSVVSPQALQKAAKVKSRGYYFDYLLFKKNAEKSQTPATPNIPLLYALKKRLEDTKAKGIGAMHEEHQQRAAITRQAVRTLGLEPYIPDTHASRTVTAVRNDRGLDIARLQEAMRKEGFELANGYGALKDKTFRIGHMGLDTQTTRQALAALQQAVHKNNF